MLELAETVSSLGDSVLCFDDGRERPPPALGARAAWLGAARATSEVEDAATRVVRGFGHFGALVDISTVDDFCILMPAQEAGVGIAGYFVNPFGETTPHPSEFVRGTTDSLRNRRHSENPGGSLDHGFERRLRLDAAAVDELLELKRRKVGSFVGEFVERRFRED